MNVLTPFTFSLLLLLPTLCRGQTPSPTDTNYVNELLRKGEAVETRQATIALTNYRKAHDFSRKINYRKGYFNSVRLLAYLLNNLGQHQEAKKVAQDALVTAKKDTSRLNLGLSHFALANTDLFLGNFSEAIPHYQRAATYMQQIGQLQNVAVVNQNLGYIYGQQDMYDQAIDYYKRALAYNLTENYRRAIAIDYFSIGNALDNLHRVAESRAYYLKAKQYVDPENDLDFMVNLYNNMGSQYSNEARYDSALYYQQEALRVARQLKNPRHELHVLMALAQTHTRLKQFKRAKQLLDESYAIATKNKASLTELLNIYVGYVDANEGLGNYKEAMKWSHKHIDADSALTNQETKTLLRDYELRLRRAEAAKKLAEKQRQIRRLEADRERQNLWLLVAVLTAVVVGIGLVLGYLYYRQRQRTAANALLAARRERELAVMQSELAGQQKERHRISKEMHDDLGASLTAIGLLSEVVRTRMGAQTTPEVEKISSISAEMITTMNEIIWSLNTRNDSLNGLIAYTRAYASEFIDNTPLTLKTEVEESPREITMRGVDRRNVFLTVKEALNNVVKHAHATLVTLRIRPEADQLRIVIDDNGIGFVANGRSSLRNGLTNMQNRMAESGGTCVVRSSPAGTRVELTFPYPAVPTDKIPQMTYGD